MKKLVAIAILALTSVTAFAAGQVGIEYDHVEMSGSNISANAYSIAPGLKFGNTLVDIKMQNATGEQSYSDGAGNTFKVGPVASYELRVKQNYSLTKAVDASIRLGIGQAQFLGQHASYYTIEPGVAFAVAPNVSFNTSYRYTNDFGGTVFGVAAPTRSNRLTGGVDYLVTKEDVVGVKLYRSLGDVDYTGINVGYTRLF